MKLCVNIEKKKPSHDDTFSIHSWDQLIFIDHIHNFTIYNKITGEINRMTSSSKMRQMSLH